MEGPGVTLEGPRKDSLWTSDADPPTDKKQTIYSTVVQSSFSQKGFRVVYTNTQLHGHVGKSRLLWLSFFVYIMVN